MAQVLKELATLVRDLPPDRIDRGELIPTDIGWFTRMHYTLELLDKFASQNFMAVPLLFCIMGLSEYKQARYLELTNGIVRTEEVVDCALQAEESNEPGRPFAATWFVTNCCNNAHKTVLVLSSACRCEG